MFSCFDNQSLHVAVVEIIRTLENPDSGRNHVTTRGTMTWQGRSEQQERGENIGSRLGLMASKVAQSVAKTTAEYQYPWREKLVKYKSELSKGRAGVLGVGSAGAA
ncbi:hypothetical protein NL676_019673 [Syzygium grande]|nr:hypothetical protein NL676_019673 [Syzygium grande]